jgi:BolA family transcriptional regulator, general stress-responsive regulator
MLRAARVARGPRAGSGANVGSMSDRMVERIERKLAAALAPARLRVIDESARHVGHAGARPGGETHFRVELEAAAFAGLTRLERQRRVHAILAEELAGGVHALSMALTAPGETGPR